MSKPLPTPDSAAELIQALSTVIDDAINSDEPSVRAQFKTGLPYLWWLEAIDKLTVLYLSSEVAVTFSFPGHKFVDGGQPKSVDIFIVF